MSQRYRDPNEKTDQQRGSPVKVEPKAKTETKEKDSEWMSPLV